MMHRISIFILLILPLVLCEDDAETNEHLNDIFFLEVDEHCDVNEKMINYIRSAIPAEEQADVAEKYTIKKNQVVQQRMLQSLNSGGISSSAQRLLQEATTKRDEYIATLNLYVSLRQKRKSRLSGMQSHSTSTYLTHLNIDIVDNTLLPNNELLNIARQFACLKYPPEQNQVRKVSTFDAYVIPNDPLSYPNSSAQWYLKGPQDSFLYNPVYGGNFYKAWAKYRGLTEPLTVAIIDTGCNEHEDLKDRICKSAECSSRNFVQGTRSTAANISDPVSHGTVIASIIASRSGNAYLTAGLCWGCKVMCLKTYDPRLDGLSLAANIEAINYIISKNIRISNHSYNSDFSSFAEMSAFAKLFKTQHIAFTAAGNEARNIDELFIQNGVRLGVYPLEYGFKNMISVGSSDPDGKLSQFSNYGRNTVDLAAPGLDFNIPYKGSETNIVCGTSVSAAIATGTAALVWSSNPHMTAAQVRHILMASVVKIPSLINYTISGGIIDAFAALEMVPNHKVDPPYEDFRFALSISNFIKYSAQMYIAIAGITFLAFF